MSPISSVPAVAQALAVLLGGVVEPYGVCEPEQCLYVRAPADLVVSVSRQPGNRIVACGVFPVDATGYECRAWGGGSKDERTSIGVSAEKPAERIAAEIQRRLIPAWMPALERARVILAQREEYSTRQAKVVEAFRAAGFDVQQGRDGEASFQGPSGTRCRVYSDSVRFEFFSCSPAKALRVLKALTEGDE